MATNNATNTSNPISVSQGGTGATTLTGVLTGNGTSAVTASTLTQHGVVVAGASNTLSTVAPGASGNLLTSNGTDWTSAAAPGGGILSASITLTSAQIKALHGTPITMISAPGVGNIIVIVKGVSKLLYGGSNVFVAGAGQTVNLAYNSVQSAISSFANNTSIIASQTNYSQGSGNTIANATAANLDNQPMTLFNPSATEISGNAANDNTMSFQVLYYIITL